MKRIIYLLFLLSFITSSSIFPSDEAKKRGNLIVKFKGINSDKGNIVIALCNSDENYEDHKSPFIGKSVPVDNNTAIIEFDYLPYGEYAIKAFHDEDANADLNTNFLGIPIEDYGFSNNARGIFGPPSWEDAKFEFSNDKKLIEIVIK